MGAFWHLQKCQHSHVSENCRLFGKSRGVIFGVPGRAPGGVRESQTASITKVGKKCLGANRGPTSYCKFTVKVCKIALTLTFWRRLRNFYCVFPHGIGPRSAPEHFFALLIKSDFGSPGVRRGAQNRGSGVPGSPENRI